jgi:hypothetical protein
MVSTSPCLYALDHLRHRALSEPSHMATDVRPASSYAFTFPPMISYADLLQDFL